MKDLGFPLCYETGFKTWSCRRSEVPRQFGEKLLALPAGFSAQSPELFRDASFK